MGFLEIKHISKSFNGRNVLDDISLEVQEGEFVTILGPSGSGKSTLFHVIGGLLVPEQGSVMLDGENITGKRGFISYMPQQPALFPWRTVLENVMLGQELHEKRDVEKATAMIEKAGLKGYEYSKPSELSGGMKQRAAFIRALLSPHSLICLDEPFSALDDFTRLEMHQWLLSIWAEFRRTILFVTHNIDEALFLSDRIIVLSSNPARVIHEVKVPFEHPRERDLLLMDEFLTLKKELYEAVGRL
ncbi:ABC transporter ATP-binding protein [Lederbergia citri]|uniref:ABC transporter ATP-binding protein n=1 Tax=Lederbergia citri TaxID=2833580 RepID=A0A942YKC6_9BACI|nr:ABC transporter ATP-binding protein [Lederbergia citri]MBS4197211.1 ABC transporter ATP-binding protein [Lederbergia citri]